MHFIKSREVRSVPGDTLRALTRAAVASDGTEYPAGTEYRPVSGGYTNVHNCGYVNVAFPNGTWATFLEKDQPK